MRGAIGRPTSVQIYVSDPLATGESARAWRFDRATAGAGLFLDLSSHYFDIVDFLAGPVTAVHGHAINTGGSYAVEDVTTAAFRIGNDMVGTGVWNFNAGESTDSITFTGLKGQLRTAVRADEDVVVVRDGTRTRTGSATLRTCINRSSRRLSTSSSAAGDASPPLKPEPARRG